MPHAWPVTAALLAALAGAVPAPVHAAAPPRVFDEDSLGALLGQIQEFNEALQEGLDGSTGALLLRLPTLWRELARLEDQLQRQLPLLREQLQAIERSLRGFETPAHPPAAGGGLIAI